MPGPFTAGEAGRALGTSRKYTIPLLEYLDATGITRRDGDRRVVVAPVGKEVSARA
ncbi:MAG: SelB C-terminal domain-containing protein [Caenispirillum bisanense]|nr:SelB C-terminal domain-containing protein [Caenispirillum bisanense]MCA1974406.1 SelB C-terminal domain-containing protein [Caenispirillum sp.]